MQDITYLRSGGGMTAEEACIMNAVDAIAQMHLHGDVVFALTDNPGCTDQILRSFAVASNDSLPDKERQELLKLADTIYLAHPMKDRAAKSKWVHAFVEWVERRIEEGRMAPQNGSIFSRADLGTALRAFHAYVEADDETKAWQDKDEVELAQSIAFHAAHAADSDDRVQLLAELLLFYDKVRADEGAMLDDWDETRPDEEWTYDEAEEHKRLQQDLENSFNSDYQADGSNVESQQTRDLRAQLQACDQRIKNRITAGQAH